jgi:uncharacterized damage-inducible protein DinB
MTHGDLTLLLEFHYWARNRTLDAASLLTHEQYARDLGNSFASVRDTLVHLYSAEWAWFERWHGVSPTSMKDPVEYPDVESLRAAWFAHEEKMRAFLASLDDEGINRIVAYRSLAGVEATSHIWEMLQHVVNHGTYHRGQITTMLRQLGATPAKSSELSVFHRERHSRQRS